LRGQASIEFIAALGMLIMIWAVFNYVASAWNAQTYGSTDGAAADEIVQTLYFESVAAKAAGSGYSHTVVLPAELPSGANYSLRLDAGEQTVLLSYSDTSRAGILPFNSIASADLPPGPVHLSNEGGTLVYS
jgi:hypothetical protein